MWSLSRLTGVGVVGFVLILGITLSGCGRIEDVSDQLDAASQTLAECAGAVREIRACLSGGALVTYQPDGSYIVQCL